MRDNTPAATPPSEPRADSTTPFDDVDGDFIEHSTGPIEEAEPSTGSYRVRISDDSDAGTMAEGADAESDDSHEIGLGGFSRVVVTEPTREDILEVAIGRWRHSLADLESGHDFLTNMRASTHLELTHSHPQGLAHLFAARGATRLSSLVREADALAHARQLAREIREISQTHAEERGLTTCYLGIGEVTWHSNDGRNVHAPILIRPINLHLRGNAREDVDLDLDSAVDLNPVLMRTLREEGVLIDARALLDLTRSHHGFDPQPVLDAFRSLGDPLPGFRVSHALVVGTLVDASGPLLDDFDAPVADLSSKTIIAALAGDDGAREQLTGSGETEGAAEAAEADPAGGDTAPDAEGDNEPVAAPDPDARLMAQAVADSPALAVHTPAGSSSVASIVALVTEELARGKRVLLLSQRSSKLSQMRGAIEDAGLDDSLLSLIPDPQLQRKAHESMLQSLAKASSFVPPVSLGEPEGLAEARETLTGHVEAMHRVQKPWGVSAHEAINALADLARRRPAPRTTVRLAPDVAERMIEQREEYRRLLQDADTSGALAMKPEDSAWYGASITSETQATRALELVTDLDESTLPDMRNRAASLGAPINQVPPTTLVQVQERITLLEDMRDLFRRVKPEIFHADIPRLLAAYKDKAYRDQHGLIMGFGERRQHRRTARDLMQGATQNEEIPTLLEKAKALHARWIPVAADPAGEPRIPDDVDATASAAQKMQRECDELRVLLAGTPEGNNCDEHDLEVFQDRAHRLMTDSGILEVLPHRTSVLRTLSFEGFGEIVDDLRERDVTGPLVLDELELAWWVSVLEFIARAEPTLSLYDGTKLSQVAERYRKLDSEHMRLGQYRVRKRIDDELVATMKRFPDTSRSAIRELNGSAAASVKDTAAKYQDIVFRARPLWLASPYMVPQMIPAGEHFDLVIFADAATLPTAAAIPALARAGQAIVVGDPFEFPGAPVSQDAGSGYLLDEVSQVAPVLRVLRDSHPATGGVRRFVGSVAAKQAPEWANVSAPPSPEQVDDDSYVYVPDGRGVLTPDVEYVESTEAELRRVTDLAIYHARHTPERSLAIITLTHAHARQVFDRVMRTVSSLPDLTDFFSASAEEFFAVVPVEAAGPIMRDDVIVSLGFGLTNHDRILHRFGPLSGPYGRRALVSALTKARGRTSVVSAVAASDLDPERLKSEGARDYRGLLEFLEGGMGDDASPPAPRADEAAKPQGESSDAGRTDSEEVGAAPQHPDADSSSALVADLADRLWRMGYTVELEYGLTNEKVELAAGHPDLPGRMLVAVMTDGPRYREVEDQRERDRLTAERLETAGWTVERVWSWALFIDPEGEAERVKKTIERAFHGYLDHQDELRVRGGSPRHRLPRPKVPAGHPLSFYGPEDFDAVVAYICSDGKARLAEQLAAEVREFLAFDSRSVLLDVSISSAIRRYQEAQQDEA